MAFNRRFRKESTIMKKISCSCGSEAKLSSRRNFPFGKKSGGITSRFYKCKSCNKNTFLNKESGGKK